MTYSVEELQEAARQIESALRKTKAVSETFATKENPNRYKSQITLAKRRIAAFELALALIEQEQQTQM